MADPRTTEIERVQQYLNFLQQQQLEATSNVQCEETVTSNNTPVSPLPTSQLLSPTLQQQITNRLVSSTFSPYPTTPTRNTRLPPVPPFVSQHNTTNNNGDDSSDRTVTNYNRARLMGMRRQGAGSSSSSNSPSRQSSPSTSSSSQMASPNGNPRPAKAPKLSIIKKMTFSLFILGNSSDNETPNIDKENELIHEGLGPRVFETDKDGSAENFKEDLKFLAQRIEHPYVEFTLMYSRGNKRQSPLLQFYDEPTASGLKSHAKALGTIRWFLRPNYNLYESKNEPGESSSETSTSNSFKSPEKNESKRNPTIRVVVDNSRELNQHDTNVYLPEPETLKELCLLQKSKNRTSIIIDSRFGTAPNPETILNIFSDQNMNPFNDITVRVEDEEGTDIGGIKRDFFWKALQTLKDGKVKDYPLFIGLPDHLCFSSIPELVNNGTYKKLALFLLHFTASTGYFCPGLSQPAFEIITNKSQLHTKNFLDCPGDEDRDAAMIISLLIGDKPHLATTEMLDKAQIVLTKHHIHDKLDRKSALSLLKKLYDSSIRIKQLPSLTQIQEVLSNSIIGTFLNQYQLYEEVCPTKEKMTVNAEDVIKAIENRNDLEVKPAIILLSSYLRRIETFGHSLSGFLLFLTGCPIISNDTSIRLEIVEKGRLIKASSCFASLEIPELISQADFDSKMNLALGPDGEYFHCC